MAKGLKKTGFYWHLHHSVLLSRCYHYEERVNAIKKSKHQNEIERRIKLFQPVKEKLPKEIAEISRAYVEIQKKQVEAWEEHEKNWKLYNLHWRSDSSIVQLYYKTRQEYLWIKQLYEKIRKKHNEVFDKYSAYLMELHEKECGCKEWNGKKLVFKT